MDSGIVNKMDELYVIIYDRKPDIVVFHEVLPKRTRVKKKLVNKDFNIEGYDFVMKAPTNGHGVILYFKHCLHVQAVQRLNDFDFDESICLQLRGNDSLLIGNIYRSPSSSKENNVKLNHLLHAAVDLKCSHILILGDFNYKNLDW